MPSFSVWSSRCRPSISVMLLWLLFFSRTPTIALLLSMEALCKVSAQGFPCLLEPRRFACACPREASSLPLQKRITACPSLLPKYRLQYLYCKVYLGTELTIQLDVFRWGFALVIWILAAIYCVSVQFQVVCLGLKWVKRVLELLYLEIS